MNELFIIAGFLALLANIFYCVFWMSREVWKFLTYGNKEIKWDLERSKQQEEYLKVLNDKTFRPWALNIDKLNVEYPKPVISVDWESKHVDRKKYAIISPKGLKQGEYYFNENWNKFFVDEVHENYFIAGFEGSDKSEKFYFRHLKPFAKYYKESE